MISPININPPKNWQDFEMLCLELWGAIWNIRHEIEFNSDNSQGQQGVDIYGPINNGRQYYGIQCKNRKLNLIDGEKNRLSISDIQVEIDKAKQFKPPLGKLVIATSLQKDKKIEEFIRLKNIENVEQNLFSIQICFWDFFERKIPEFQRVYDWYIKNENFHKISGVTVSLDNNLLIKKFTPKFQRNIDRYILKSEDKKYDFDPLKALININQQSDFFNIIKNIETQRNYNLKAKLPTIEWEQLCWFKLYIKNSGQSVIEDYKIELEFEGNFIEVGVESPSFFSREHFENNVKEYSNSKRSLYIKPIEKILVQADGFFTNNIYIKPKMEQPASVKLNWKLLARDFEDYGFLFLEIKPKYFVVENTHDVSEPDQIRVIENFSLIKRSGVFDPIHGNRFYDKESDYNFD